jgi:hypothetical protein
VCKRVRVRVSGSRTLADRINKTNVWRREDAVARTTEGATTRCHGTVHYPLLYRPSIIIIQEVESPQHIMKLLASVEQQNYCVTTRRWKVYHKKWKATSTFRFALEQMVTIQRWSRGEIKTTRDVSRYRAQACAQRFFHLLHGGAVEIPYQLMK